jgi:hypothetical protein
LKSHSKANKTAEPTNQPHPLGLKVADPAHPAQTCPGCPRSSRKIFFSGFSWADPPAANLGLLPPKRRGSPASCLSLYCPVCQNDLEWRTG